MVASYEQFCDFSKNKELQNKSGTDAAAKWQKLAADASQLTF
jgi:hypothetical protein